MVGRSARAQQCSGSGLDRWNPAAAGQSPDQASGSLSLARAKGLAGGVSELTAVGALALAAAAFVGTHFLLSHPLRTPLIARIGEKAFAGLYSLVALALFGGMIWVYPTASAEAPQPLWDAGRIGFIVATLLMWLGSVLFMGSLRRNPALPRPGRPIQKIDDPHGVYSITRHPM